MTIVLLVLIKHCLVHYNPSTSDFISVVFDQCDPQLVQLVTLPFCFAKDLCSVYSSPKLNSLKTTSAAAFCCIRIKTVVNSLRAVSLIICRKPNNRLVK